MRGAGGLRRLRILTWHIHGSYLYYLVQGAHDFYVPVKPGRPQGYSGRSGNFPWPDNVFEVGAEQVRDLALDCILFQSRKNYERDQYEILTGAQRALPRIYLEHDPPREHPTDTRHWVNDPNVLLVHVTAFNDLMWDSGRTPTRVIEHGVKLPEGLCYTGKLERGLVVVNDLLRRGRRVGADLYWRVKQAVPLDLVGIDSERAGGLGDIPHDRLPALQIQYRFFFHPIRYTSLGLAVCEAMLLGMPIIGLATTELVTVIENHVSGYVDTDVDRLIVRMRELLAAPSEARRLGAGARRTAQERFHIERFIRDWDDAFILVSGSSPASRAGTAWAGSRAGESV